MPQTDRYRILELLAEGGFGKVYKARLERAQGYTKLVALKVLHAEQPEEHILKRFRDEARILGLVADRAIVHADAPLLLGGRWAVVMEFVDGVSAKKLMEAGPIPLGVALQIVGEVARALDKVYDQAGPDGQPLRLLHRDLKPDNIQVTGTGEVKILDFGFAKADFAHRESHTTHLIGGTQGYMAPERFEGVEAPAGDVFSLGIVLGELLLGEVLEPCPLSPSKQHAWLERQLSRLDQPPHVMRLLQAMISPEPRRRPEARAVARECRNLSRDLLDPALEDWAEGVVPPLVRQRKARSDELVAKVLSPSSEVPVAASQAATVMLDKELPPPVDVVRVGKKRKVWPWVVGSVLALAVAAVAVVLGATGVGVGAWALLSQPEVEAPPGSEDLYSVKDALEASGESVFVDLHALTLPEPPAVPPSAADATLEVLLASGQVALDAGNLPGAAEAFGQALGKQPGDAMALHGYGAVLLQQGDTQRAQRYLCAARDRAAGQDLREQVQALLTDGGLSCEVEAMAEVIALEQAQIASTWPCAPEAELEEAAILGQLATGDRTCLSEASRDPERRLTERSRLARILLHDAQVRCKIVKSGCADYKAEMIYYIEEIDGSDADILFDWLQYLRTTVQDADADYKYLVAWSGRTLSLRQQWSEEVFVQRTSSTHNLRSWAAYQRYVLANAEATADRSQEVVARENLLRNEARGYVLEWMDYNKAAGLDYSKAQALCRDVANDTRQCEG